MEISHSEEDNSQSDNTLLTTGSNREQGQISHDKQCNSCFEPNTSVLFCSKKKRKERSHIASIWKVKEL
jgi:hypothetical protein